MDWTDADVWRDHKTVDLACGSGTLLAAMLTDMKRRAREQGANEAEIADLQKLAVEETIKGLDINPVSLQLAASQLTAGNQEIRYRQMGLHLMPYGPSFDDPTKMSAGTLELLGQKAIVPRDNELNLGDDKIGSQIVWNQPDDAELEDAVDAVKDACIVIMNPPFTSRAKMGEKFPQGTQQALRSRVDDVGRILVASDPGLIGFSDKNSIGPLFVALADHCTKQSSSILAMINPTIALSATSGLKERQVLAQRYHIHTVLTGRWPREFTLSQNVEIDECLVIAVRHSGNRPPTRFIHLDRMPHDENGATELHRALLDCLDGPLDDGWGAVSYWPAERIAEGDWTPAIWRSPELAKAARWFANHDSLQPLDAAGLSAHQTGRELYTPFERGSINAPNAFPVIKSKGAEGQSRIQSSPDEYWVPKKGYGFNDVQNFLRKREHLLITEGQDNRTARLVAVASDEKHVGGGWMPVEGLTAEEAKAIAVFFNSTAGRLQLMRNAGKKIFFPTYRPAGLRTTSIPDLKDDRIHRILSDCWERTKDMVVPQFRDGECEVRRLWDEAVAEAMGWDADELAHLRELLNNEPHVRGLGYNQYADAKDTVPEQRERFQQLADQWEEETFFLSRSDHAIAHPVHQEIINLGQPVVPFILERMRSRGGHWFEALQQITGEDPVSPADYGNIAAMQNSWLQWGEDLGYA